MLQHDDVFELELQIKQRSSHLDRICDLTVFYFTTFNVVKIKKPCLR